MKSKSDTCQISKPTCSQCHKDNKSSCRPLVAVTLFVLASYCTSTCHVHAARTDKQVNDKFTRGHNLKHLDRLDHRRYNGIFPRGGAVDRYTDVLQIAQHPLGDLRARRRGASGVERGSINRMSGGSALGREWQQDSRNLQGKRSRMSRKRILNRLYASPMSTLHRHHRDGSVSSSSMFYHSFPHVVSDYKGGEILNSYTEDEKEDIGDGSSRPEEGFFSGWKAKSWNPGQNLERPFAIQEEKEELSSLPFILTRKDYGYDDMHFNKDQGASHTLTQKKSRNTIIYRYFGRSVARSSKSDSIPFIVLAPSTDHWKIVGKILAARGFNVMVCERTKEQKEKRLQSNFSTKEERSEELDPIVVEGEALTSAVLDALKWQRAILVGCDQEAALALEAALNLAPDRVAGLVLCGDLSDLEKEIERSAGLEEVEGGDEISLDGFLRDYVDCPCSIIWDGDASSWSTSHGQDFDSSAASKMSADGNLRSVVIGGGLAPHRRMPEQFAWSLTRFVENKVSMRSREAGVDAREMQSEVNKPQHIVWRDILPPKVVQALDEIFAPGSLLVTGRVIATAIIYLSITRVSLFHYHNIRGLREAVMNPQNLRKILTIPGILLQRKMKLLPDIKENDKQSNVQSSSERGSSGIEKIEEKDDNIQSPPTSPPRAEEELDPEPRSNHGTKDNMPLPPPENLAEKEHLYKFLFFDQIVS